jgi:hypothetical protein
MLHLKPFFLMLSLFLGGAIFFAIGQAEYEVKLDTIDKKVYLVSGDTKISVENVSGYFS